MQRVRAAVLVIMVLAGGGSAWIGSSGSASAREQPPELRPTELPPYEDGPFAFAHGAYRGPDYRLKVWSDGGVEFAHDDGSRAIIELRQATVNAQAPADAPNTLIAIGRVIESGGSAPPAGAWVGLQPNLEPVKGSKAVFAVFFDAPGRPTVFEHVVCHPVIGNGAFEVYPC